MTVEGLNCSVTLQKVQKNTYLSQDYLLAQSDKDCTCTQNFQENTIGSKIRKDNATTFNNSHFY